MEQHTEQAMRRRTTLQFSLAATAPLDRPAQCPNCSSPSLRRHGILKRALNDAGSTPVSVHRYLCAQCGTSFRHYPAGVGRSRRSMRLVALAALLCSLGLSYAKTAQALRALDARLNSATVWRAVRAAGLKELPRADRSARVRVLQSQDAVDLVGAEVLMRFLSSGDDGEMLGVEVWDGGDQPLPELLHELAGACGGNIIAEILGGLETAEPIGPVS